MHPLLWDIGKKVPTQIRHRSIMVGKNENYVAYNTAISKETFTLHLWSNSGEHDQTPRSVASDLVLHCLPMAHKKEAKLKWVKTTLYQRLFRRHVPSIFSSNEVILISERITKIPLLLKTAQIYMLICVFLWFHVSNLGFHDSWQGVFLWGSTEKGGGVDSITKQSSEITRLTRYTLHLWANKDWIQSLKQLFINLSYHV